MLVIRSFFYNLLSPIFVFFLHQNLLLMLLVLLLLLLLLHQAVRRGETWGHVVGEEGEVQRMGRAARSGTTRKMLMTRTNSYDKMVSEASSPTSP